MKKLMKLMESQIIRYIVTGVLTTGINYLLYFALTALTADYLTANSIAWVGAVIFAFFANRSVVFHSCGNRGKEFAGFIGARLLTLMAENLFLVALIEWLGAGLAISKLFAGVITTALNYFACRYGVFKGGVSHE